MFSERFLSNEPAKAELFLQILSFNRARPGSFTSNAQARRPTIDDLSLVARRTPLLLLLGEYDVVQPVQLVAAAAKLVPEARLSIISECGHSAYFENPGAFNQCVRGFLSESLVEGKSSVGRESSIQA
jgi:pimeloyl-ACP methyl ester carboxylesterase